MSLAAIGRLPRLDLSRLVSRAARRPLAVTGVPGPATVGQAYSFAPSVSGGAGARSYALTGSLPAGLTFSAITGAITGTPSAAGTASGLAIAVTDSSGSAALSGLSITVASAPVQVGTLDFSDPAQSGHIPGI